MRREFNLTIDRTSGIPLFLQIKNRILYEISVANLPPGTVLPSIRQLASQLGVATATVRHAYASLEAEGFVVTRQGKGMLVGELNAHPRVESTPYREQIVSLFASTIARAHATGASLEDIKAAIIQALARWEGRPKVLFVGADPQYLEHYPPFIVEALHPLPVDVSAILLQDFEDIHPAAFDWLVPPVCVVTLVRSYSRVRRILDDSPIPIVAMALKLSDDTKRNLMELPRDTQVILVSEHSNIAGFQHLIEQYLPLDQPPVQQVLEAADLSAPLEHAEVIVHSLRARQAVRQSAPPTARIVELTFVPEPLSLSQIHEIVSSQLKSIDGDYQFNDPEFPALPVAR